MYYWKKHGRILKRSFLHKSFVMILPEQERPIFRGSMVRDGIAMRTEQAPTLI
jgi:hypothetical protein